MPQTIEQDSTLSSVANRVTEAGERVRLKIGDREVAVVSLEHLDFLEDIEAAEDRNSFLGGALRRRKAEPLRDGSQGPFCFPRRARL